MQYKGIVALGSGGHAPVEAVIGVQLGGHFLFAFAVCLRLREETAVPLVQTERGICHHHLEFHQGIVLNILRVGESIALPDTGIVHAVQEHIHGTKRPGLLILFLAIDRRLPAGHLLIRFQQQAAAAAGGIVDAIIFPGLYQRGHQLGDLAGGKELTAFLSGVRGKHGNHVFICVADDIGRTQLTGTQVKGIEVLQQVPQSCVFLLRFAKIHLGVKINGAEHIAQLPAVVFLNVVQRYINSLPDFRIVPVSVKEVKCGLRVHREAFPAHGPFHPANIPIILFDIPFTPLIGNIAEVLYE